MSSPDGKPYRLIGDSRFVDQETGREHVNSWHVSEDGRQLSVRIGALERAREARALRTRNRHTRWFMGEIQKAITAEEYRKSPPRSIPKAITMRKKYPRIDGRCAECSGTREIYYRERLIDCPVCTRRHR
jgi:hypothetical protein